MIKLPLPFEMGKQGKPDPYTFLQDIDHPILEIGSSSASLKQEIQEWLNSTCKEWRFSYNNGYALYFVTEQDYMMFILRWT